MNFKWRTWNWWVLPGWLTIALMLDWQWHWWIRWLVCAAALSYVEAVSAAHARMLDKREQAPPEYKPSVN